MNDKNKDPQNMPNMPTAGNSPFVSNMNSGNTNVAQPKTVNSSLPNANVPTTPEITQNKPQNPPQGNVPAQSVSQTQSNVSQPNAGQPAVHSQAPENNTPPPVNKSKRVKKALMIISVLVVISAIIGVAYYFYRQNQLDSTNEMLNESEEMTNETENDVQRVAYATGDLIGAVTSILSADTYRFIANNSVTNNSGCAFVESIEVDHYVADFSVLKTISLVESTDTQVCLDDSVEVEYTELYSVDDEVLLKSESGGDFVAIDSVPDNLQPRTMVNQTIPYPTLLTVNEAIRTDQGLTEVSAGFETNDQTGTYVFQIDENGRITSVEYDLDDTSATTSGELSIFYSTLPIQLPGSSNPS